MFEKLKERLKEKIENDSIKSELNGEIVYLKKSKLPLIGDWGRIYPPINEDGSWNLFNFIFGGHRNLIKLIIVLLIVGMVYMGFIEIFSQYSNLVNEPCVQTCISNTLNTLP